MVLWMLIILVILSTALSRNAIQDLLAARWIRDEVSGRFLAKAGIERVLLELQTDPYLTFDAMNDNWASKEKAFKDISFSNGVFSVVCDPDGVLKEKENSDNDSKLVGATTKKKLRYGACDESSRINLNFADTKVLNQLLIAANPKMDSGAAEKIAESIVDWRDTDDAAMQEGAETSFYKFGPHPYEARNAPMQSVEELLMVRGVTPEIFESVKDYVTVYTPKGKINFNTASFVVLQALGLNQDLASRMIDYRKGGDGVDGTEDDQTFQVVEGITPALSNAGNFSSQEFAQISNAIAAGIVTVQSNTFRIHSIGRLIRNGRNLETRVTCVVRRDGTVLYWHEGDF